MAAHALDAVLPLKLRDYARFEILDRSLRRNFPDLGVCWVVTTGAEHDELRRMIDADVYTVVPESSVIPDLTPYWALYRFLYETRIHRLLRGRYCAAGWFVQQLVKLAIAERIETDFYLTLDADVICVKPVGRGDLVENGRALTSVRPDDLHPDWYVSAERILGAKRSGLTHGVTPAILSRDATLSLQEFIATRVGHPARALGALFPRGSWLRDVLRGWRSHLLRNTPWTEYSLYHTFLESTGTFDRYHVRAGPDAIYDSDRSVWAEEDFSGLDMEAVMRGGAFFLVVQSTARVAADDVWRKVEPYLA